MLSVAVPSVSRLLAGVVIIFAFLQGEVSGLVEDATPVNRTTHGKSVDARAISKEVASMQKALSAAGNFDVILALMTSGKDSGAYTYISYVQSVLSIPSPMTLFLANDDAWKRLSGRDRSKILALHPQELVRFLQFSTLKSSAYSPGKLAAFPKGRYFGTADLNILIKVNKANAVPPQLSPLGKQSNTVGVVAQLFQAKGLSVLQVSDFLLPPGW
eukprot:TRINITY_DN2085_c0_g1_i1.p1 TRINITY_DN2085_c0_g1~~TRINITY_DN2085_c0_g1_i1.p1  ORF type:complete len:215 (-),score=43.72 TRINITY_DN2085_c0_g1_i1:705-1349(-)